MAAAVTLLTGATFNTNSGTKTATGTPAVGDLIIIVRAHSGNTTSTAPTDNNSSGTYTLVTSAVKNSSADKMEVYVRNSLIGTSTSTIFTDAAGTTTGGGLAVIKVTGMSVAGLSAVRSTGSQANQTSATPAPVLNNTPLTTNPIIGAVFNASSPATMTPRTSFTELSDVGYLTPTTGLEVMSRNSGETSATLTWGSLSTTSFASVAVELAYDTAPTVALNTADASSFGTSTPTVEFTGTDADAEDVRYNVQVDTTSSFGVIDSYAESNANDWSETMAFSNKGFSQSFTGDGGSVSSAAFSLLKGGAPTGNITAKIYAQTGTFGAAGDFPTGSALATSNTVNVSALTTTAQLITFTFSTPYATVNGTKYHIAVEFGSSSNSDYVAVGVDTTSSSAAGHRAVLSSGGTWQNPTIDTWDMIFYVYRTMTLDKVSGTDSGFANTVTGGDTDPFNSGEKVSYTVQAGDALANGTYYWKARALDPTGTNSYGAWATTRSFTVSTGSTNTTNFFQFF